MDTFNLSSLPTRESSSATLSARLSSLPWHIILPTLVISYLSLVRLLRFRALHLIEKKYAPYLTDPYALTYKQAQEIMLLPVLHDTPFLFAFATQWALIKSYGIATGTPLLVKTRQLSNPKTVGKRAEDTAVFLAELLAGDIDSPRGRLALSKLNWLHHRHSILNGDYVHTLALFVLEPHAWIARYEWRPLTHLEKVAHLIYWRELGHRMGFAGIPQTLEALAAWKADYEKTHLYFVPSNRIVADATLDLFLTPIPKSLRPLLRTLFLSFIDEPAVLSALGYDDPPPPKWATLLTSSLLTLRGFLIKHLFLPRLRPIDITGRSKGPGEGRLQRDPRYVGFEPWYVADTWYNRLVLWWNTGGRMIPGKDFKSEGYLPEELGPTGFEKIARQPVRDQAEAMEEYIKSGSSAAGCPFNFGWEAPP